MTALHDAPVDARIDLPGGWFICAPGNGENASDMWMLFGPERGAVADFDSEADARAFAAAIAQPPQPAGDVRVDVELLHTKAYRLGAAAEEALKRFPDQVEFRWVSGNPKHYRRAMGYAVLKDIAALPADQPAGDGAYVPPKTPGEAIERMLLDGDADPIGTAMMNYPALFEAAGLTKLVERLYDPAPAASRPDRGAAVEAVWEALKHQCASTRPDDEKWLEVRKLVMVRREDVAAALRTASREPASREVSEEEVERAIDAHFEIFDSGDAVGAMRAALEAFLTARTATVAVEGFQPGDRVEKHTGDHQLEGEVRATFTTKAGKVRHVVEHDFADVADLVRRLGEALDLHGERRDLVLEAMRFNESRAIGGILHIYGPANLRAARTADSSGGAT